jgi:hypothetical protein
MWLRMDRWIIHREMCGTGSLICGEKNNTRTGVTKKSSSSKIAEKRRLKELLSYFM